VEINSQFQRRWSNPGEKRRASLGGRELRLAGGATIGAKLDGELAAAAHAYAGTVFLALRF
jgi:hypothetical protein